MVDRLSSLRSWTTFAGCALVVAVLYWAQAVLVPVSLAILITFVLTPPVIWLQRRIGRLAAVLVVVTLVFSGLGLSTWAIRAADEQPEHRPYYLPRQHPRRRSGTCAGRGRGGSVEKLQSTLDEIKKDIGVDDGTQGHGDAAGRRFGPAAVRLLCLQLAGSVRGACQYRRIRGRARPVHAARAGGAPRSADRSHRSRSPRGDDEGIRRGGQPGEPSVAAADARERDLWRARRGRSLGVRRAVPALLGRRGRRSSLHPVHRSGNRVSGPDSHQPRGASRLDAPSRGRSASTSCWSCSRTSCWRPCSMQAPRECRRSLCWWRWPSGPGCGDRSACSWPRHLLSASWF